MSLPFVQLKPGKDIPVRGGHPWIFSNALTEESNYQHIEPGKLVQVKDAKGIAIATGYWNANTSIRVRILSLDPKETIDERFFLERFQKLDTWKCSHLPKGTTGYRLVHAEADGLPGLIVDRYADVFVFQIHTYGMDRLRDMVINGLKMAFEPSAIVERSDVDVRRVEGLTDEPVKVHFGTVDAPVAFQEYGITFSADVMQGQKTGFFLDQREARHRVGLMSKGKRVLNLFGYTGGFSLHAAMNGATFVTTVDSSRPALEMAQSQFKQNGLDAEDEKKYQFMDADVFELMADQAPFGPYEVIVCDPPALAKSERHLEQATKAYIELNTSCFEQLSEGGVLVTSSCSGRITPEDFRSIIKIAAGRAGKDVRLLDWLQQPVDHAERLSFPEGRYLKTAIVEVTGRVPLAKPNANR